MTFTIDTKTVQEFLLPLQLHECKLVDLNHTITVTVAQVAIFVR